jgi:hypothetical protein
MASDIFLSYSRADRLIAEQFVKTAAAHGVNVWFDERIGGGEDWRERIVDALDAAKALVILFSEHSNGSRQLIKELAIADGYQGECLSDNYLDNYGVTLQSETKAIRVTREESSTFQVCSPKKGKHIRACELNNPTKVRTKWGDFSGKTGDYLIYHSKEDYYICDGEIFHLTYQHYRVP